MVVTRRCSIVSTFGGEWQDFSGVSDTAQPLLCYTASLAGFLGLLISIFRTLICQLLRVGRLFTQGGLLAITYQF